VVVLLFCAAGVAVPPAAKAPAADIDKSKPTTIRLQISTAAIIPAFCFANQIPSIFQYSTPDRGIFARAIAGCPLRFKHL
jgi:hypothetical protein